MARARNLLPLLFGALALGALVFAGPAAAQEMKITEFVTTASTSEAGAHPDLRTKFKLTNAGEPEIAKDVTFELPKGMFGNPSVLTQCSSVDFSLDQCPPSAQAGLITVRAFYNNEPDYLLGTAPIYSVDPGADEAARFALNVPTLNIPIAIPVNVLSADGYRLRFTVSGITQLAPLSAADLTFWGFPADESHQGDRFGKGSPGKPAGCPGVEGTSCPEHTEFPQAGMPTLPFTGNPSVCHEPMPTTLEVETYQTPGTPVTATSSYKPITDCDRQTFKPVAQAKLTTAEADAPSGIDLIVRAPQVQSKATSPSQVRTVVLRLPEGLTINPDAADGQSACSDVDAALGTEAPAHCPDNAKIGTITISSAALPDDLKGAIYFGEPKPGNQYRLLVIAEGFGITTKFLGDLLPDPKTGQISAVFRDLPQLPFDEYGVHLFASDRGVLATPTRCGIHITETNIFPWNNLLPDQKAQFGVSIDSGPGSVLCPGEKRPFHPRLEAGTSNSQAGGFSNFYLKLDRDDGDQYPRRPQLHDAAWPDRIAAGPDLLPRGIDRRRGGQGGPRGAGFPELPRVQQAGNDERRRRAGLPPVPCGWRHLPGRAAERRAALPGGDHPGPCRALRLWRRRRQGRDRRRPGRRARDRLLGHGSVDHRRRADPDAVDPGEPRQAQLHDQPDELRADVGRLAGDRRPGRADRLLLLLPGDQLLEPPVQAEASRCDRGWAASRPAVAPTRRCASSCARGRATPTSRPSP